MKKLTGMIMTLLICLALTGCSQEINGTAAADNPNSGEIRTATTGSAISEEQLTDTTEQNIVTYECKKGSISLRIPDGWSHKIKKYKKTKNDESFGITFWKDGKKKKAMISVQYIKPFGVCGTGLVGKKLRINGLDSEAGYYDGKPYWDYIIFLNGYENFVILNFCENKNWWNTYGDQVMEILNTLTIKKK